MLPLQPAHAGPRDLTKLGLPNTHNHPLVAINWLHLNEPQWTTVVFPNCFYTYVLINLFD